MLSNKRMLFAGLVLSCAIITLIFTAERSFEQPLPIAKLYLSYQPEREDIPVVDSKLNFELAGEGLTLSLWNYKKMESRNNMRINFDECERRVAENGPSNSFTVITNFAYIDPEDPANHNLQIQEGLKVNELTINMRNMEIMNVLASNLNHSSIKEIHILVQHPKTAEYLSRLPLQNSHKAVVQVLQRNIEMNTQLRYAGRCLKNRIVAISHQDNQYGEGWEKFKPEPLIQKRLMFALTRHTATIPCKASKYSANCNHGYPYIGSHDVFMYHVKEEFTAEQLQPMDTVTPNLSGMENLLIWLFQTRLGYTVRNPCPVLVVYHQHCIALRGPNRRRVNGGGRSGGAGFTNQLE